MKLADGALQKVVKITSARNENQIILPEGFEQARTVVVAALAYSYVNYGVEGVIPTIGLSGVVMAACYIGWDVYEMNQLRKKESA